MRYEIYYEDRLIAITSDRRLAIIILYEKGWIYKSHKLNGDYRIINSKVQIKEINE